MVHKNIGCRSEVFRGKAKRTSGGLKKEDIVRNKYGRYVSKERSEQAKRSSHLGEWLFKPGGRPVKLPKPKKLTISPQGVVNIKGKQKKLSISAPRAVNIKGKQKKLSISSQGAVNIKGKNEPLSKQLMARAIKKIDRDGWEIKKKKPTKKKSTVKNPAKPAKEKKYVIKKPSKKKPDKSVYLLPEPGAAKKKKQKKSGK